MWAATLAGIAFGNAGVHVPHAMAYEVAGQVRTFRAAGYPDAPLVPHGMAVAVSAPTVFRATAATSPTRHREAAELLGADVRGAGDGDGGEVLALRLIAMMREIAIPNGLSGVGYARGDVAALVGGALPQQRLLQNAPMAIDAEVLARLFEGSLAYW
jgi:alcohol dehydrogenase class IV